MAKREAMAIRNWFDLRTLQRRTTALAVLATMTVVIVSTSADGAVAKEMVFATPEQAVDSLTAAIRAGSRPELIKILGPDGEKLVSSGDAVADAQAREKFLAEFEDASKIDRQSDDRAILVLGKDEWSFPIPIVQRDGGWQFDAKAGEREILDRRIGANELYVIEVCGAYVGAQREYATKDRTGSGFLEYAQKFVSRPNSHDGLYWPAREGEDESPIGPLLASARSEGYGGGGDEPYHGYYYRILKGQGPAAKGGAYDYVVKGHMIAGFALVAFPARYGASGIMTFIVSHDGIVFQKDLGPNTAELASKLTRFNPDHSWKTP